MNFKYILVVALVLVFLIAPEAEGKSVSKKIGHALEKAGKKAGQIIHNAAPVAKDAATIVGAGAAIGAVVGK